MGYTIYWKWTGGKKPMEWFRKIQRDVDAAYRLALLDIQTSDGKSLYEIFMLCKTLPVEHFYEGFAGEMMTDSKFSFCKTARRSYDLAVKKALIHAQWLSGNAWEITCDDGGEYKKDTVLVEGGCGTWLPSEMVKKEGREGKEDDF